MLLVTGATGNTGSHFLRELESAAYTGPVRCLVRADSDVTSLQESSLRPEIVEGKINDPRFLNWASQGIDTIVHIASIKFTLDILRAALNNVVRRVVLVHTTGVYSGFKAAAGEYLQIEREMNELLAAAPYPIDVVVVRPTMIFGQPRDRNMSVFIRMVDKFRVLPLINNGSSLLQPVHGKDLGRGLCQIVFSERLPQSDYVLSGERPITLREMLATISRLLDKRVYFVNVPLSMGVMAARGIRLVTLGKVDAVERVQRMGEDRSFPHEAAGEHFAYAPSPFLESLKREIEMYKSNQGNDK